MRRGVREEGDGGEHYDQAVIIYQHKIYLRNEYNCILLYFNLILYKLAAGEGCGVGVMTDKESQKK